MKKQMYVPLFFCLLLCTLTINCQSSDDRAEIVLPSPISTTIPEITKVPTGVPTTTQDVTPTPYHNSIKKYATDGEIPEPLGNTINLFNDRTFGAIPKNPKPFAIYKSMYKDHQWTDTGFEITNPQEEVITIGHSSNIEDNICWGHIQ